jgi:CheY-like chemotaxis protein
MASTPPRSIVLVVEDNAETRTVLERVLRIRGYDVVTARDGLDALAYLQSGGRPAAIILDIAMPVMDGIELAQHLRATPEWAHIPVVVYTALRSKRIPDTAGIIRKGTDDPDRLLAALAKVIGRPGPSS